MRRSRAVLALGALVAVAVAAFAVGCGSSSSTSTSSSPSASAVKPTGAITFLVSSTPTVDNLLKQIPAFEKQTGIKVNVANIDYDSMTQKETLDLRSKTGQYDVFWVEGTFLGRYVGQLHGLEPLDTYAASQGVDLGLSDFPNQLKQNFSMNGHLYAMPFEATLMMQAYRTDLYQKAGLQPATTLPAYLSNVAKLNNPPKIYGTEVMGQRGEPIFYEWVNWLWGEGGQLFDASGQPTIDSPQAVKALEDVITLAKSAPAGTVNYGWDQATTAFGQGNVTAAVLFSDQTPGLLDPTASKVTGKWAYSPFPGTNPTAFGGYSWGMNAFSNNKPAALAFIQWATSKQVLSSLVPGGSSPPRISIQSDTALQAKYPWLKAEEAAAPRAQVPMTSPYYFQLVDAISAQMNSALTGGTTPQKAMQTAQKQWQQILTTGGGL
jgi:multiple sugar transport system substrate-binding protein